MTRRTLLLCLAVVAVLAAVLVVAFWKPLLIAHHRKAMISTRDRLLAGYNCPTPLENLYGRIFIPDPYLENWGLLGHHSYHVERLVQLGELERRDFLLKHIDEATALLRAIRLAFPDNIDCQTTFDPHSPQPMKITVWDRPERLPEWEQFFAEHDVPDLRDRLMPSRDENGFGRAHNTP